MFKSGNLDGCGRRQHHGFVTLNENLNEQLPITSRTFAGGVLPLLAGTEILLAGKQ